MGANRLWVGRLLSAGIVMASLAVTSMTPMLETASFAVGDRAQETGTCFSDTTNFCIGDADLQKFFVDKGRIDTFGYPVSRVFTFLGCPVQIYQRQILQHCQGQAITLMNLLDPDIMPYTRINGSVFPAPDDQLKAATPKVQDLDYSTAILAFVRANAPDMFSGQPVNFGQTFTARGGLEIWGAPISRPAPDPGNPNFIYQRFQRGIMHYRTGIGTESVLLADYLKAIIANNSNLPSDLRAQAQSSRYFNQYCPANSRWLCRPNDLPGTDLTSAFEPAIPGGPTPTPSATATPTSVPSARPIISITSNDLDLLAPVLAPYGKTPRDVNTDKTVSFVLPRANGVVSLVAPMASPPVQTAAELTTAPKGTPIGVLQTGRALSMPGSPALQPDIYLVVVRGGRMVFAGTKGAELTPNLNADLRVLTTPAEPPRALATQRYICFSWNLIQVCTPPTPLSGLSVAEQGNLRNIVSDASDRLNFQNANLNGIMAEAEGSAAVNQKQASIVAAPTDAPRFDYTSGTAPPPGSDLGVFVVLLPVDVAGIPRIEPGPYRVSSESRSQGPMVARLTSPSGATVDVPAKALQVLAKPEQFYAILVGIHIGLCLFEC